MSTIAAKIESDNTKHTGSGGSLKEVSIKKKIPFFSTDDSVKFDVSVDAEDCCVNPSFKDLEKFGLIK